MKPIHIFKAGRHTATNGKTYDFTEQMLADAAAAYDPAVHEAPFVLGHPKSGAAAVAWAQSLTVTNGDAEVVPSDVDPAFAEAWAQKKFKKISASWYLPDSPNNPKPGVLYLRHVGVLGAEVPAIKGLRQAEFSEGEVGVVDFADWGDVRLGRLLRSLRDWMLAKFGQEEADKALPGWDIDSVQMDAALKPDDKTPSYTEEETALNDQLKEREAALVAREKAIADRENKLKADAAAARTASFAEFIGGLVKDGRLLPAHQAGLVEFMAGESETGVVEFGEGDARTSTPRIDWLKKFLSELPKAVDFSERAPAGTATGVAAFTAAPGAEVDPELAELHNKIVDYAEKNDVSYEVAQTVVTRQPS
ncbi:peptidase [Hydrocarboniphaga effusa]|uniref:peptidase n=1 Tax=Hydrocarboniphaga effusa TaxID=243629 RepID=UPI003BAD874C